MSNIRFMTFNIQAQAWPAPTSSEAISRAEAVVKALDPATTDLLDLPDVVAFNEADNEDAKDILVDGLKAIYPHFCASFGGFPAKPDDGGLAIFSKFPFVTLPDTGFNVNNNKALFVPYADVCNSSDCLSDKGVVVVQLSTNQQFEVVTLAITHMQAFYDFVGQYEKTRFKQLQAIENALTLVLGPPGDGGGWNKVVVMGDLNIRGDLKPSRRGEWRNVFVVKPSIFSQNLVDSWRTFMKPPGAIQEKDPGLTNYNLSPKPKLPAGLEERLDYICLPTPPLNLATTMRVLMPHYMRILPINNSMLHQKFRNVGSDHKALFADIHWSNPHSAPFDAVTQAGFIPHIPQGSLVALNTATLAIPNPGMYQWVYIGTPGTYTFFTSDKVETHFFFDDEVSTMIDPYAKIVAKDFGFEWLEPMLKEFRLHDEGVQVDIHKPMFIRLRGGRDNPNFVGSINIGFIKHTGETRQLAIKIRPWEKPLNPNLPFGQKNGQNDECWFLASIEGVLTSADAHNSHFYVDNTTGSNVKIALFEGIDAPNPVMSGGNNLPQVTLDYSSAKEGKIYLLLQRMSINDVDFRVGWRNEITYLSNSYLRLFCVTETSGLGADEIRIKLFADDMAIPFLNVLREDFDDNELKSIADGLPNNCIVFKDKIRIEVIEEDGVVDPDDGIFTATINVLTPTDPGNIFKTAVEFVVDDGLYRLEYGLSRSL